MKIFKASKKLDFGFDFLKYNKPMLIASVVLSIISIFLVIFKGINATVEFTGGLAVEGVYEGEGLDKFLEQNFAKDTYEVKSTGGDYLVVRFKNNQSVGDKMVQDTQERFAKLPGFKLNSIEYIAPQIGKEMLLNSLLALGFAVAGIFIYLSFRLEWQFGVGVALALIHDCIITLGLVSLFGLSFGVASIAAILTVLGYSVNDSVIIYERIKENIRFDQKISLYELINNSLNQTLTRTMMTSGTTLISVIILVLLLPEIRSFSLIIFMGIFVGTYSSIFVSASALLYFRPSRYIAVKD